jgi:hypothetical protein
MKKAARFERPSPYLLMADESDHKGCPAGWKRSGKAGAGIDACGKNGTCTATAWQTP